LPNADQFARVLIDAAMRERARQEQAARQIRRTRASPADAYIGVLGELVWARLRYGDIGRLDTLSTS
jgi:hypothetical protein